MATTTAAVATPTTTNWTLDATHSNVEFSVRHLMIATARGRFSGVTGAVVLDEENPAQSSIDVTIDASTVDTREPQRDTHLRSADFFDAEHYPVIVFNSRKVERLSEERYRAIGQLTIRGVSRPVVLDITAEGRTKDPWGHERAGFSATAKIKRSDFGLTWNQILEAGGVAVGDEVRISVDAELVKQ
jgi:polyisoprenoid-binding protein YceI